MGTVGGSIMMRHVLILGLVTAAVQTFKLDAPEQVAVCTLGSTLSIPTRLDTALYECGFYDMKESYGNKPEKFGRAGKGGKGKNAGKGNSGKGNGGKGNGGKGKGGKGKGGKGKGNGGKKCTSYKKILKDLQRKAEMDKCILESLDWIDSLGTPNATIQEIDIATLMPVIQAGVQGNEECIKEKVEEFEEKLRECGKPEFTESQIQTLVELYKIDAAGSCLLGGFFEACTDLVDNVVDFVFGTDWTQVEASELSNTIVEGLSTLTGVTEEVMTVLLASFTTFLATLTGSSVVSG